MTEPTPADRLRDLYLRIFRKNRILTEAQIEHVLSLERSVRLLGVRIDILEIAAAKANLTSRVVQAVRRIAEQHGLLAKHDDDASTVPDEVHVRLGELAVRNRLIPRRALDEALSLQESVHRLGLRKPIGEILVDKGHLRQDLLDALLDLQAYLLHPSSFEQKAPPNLSEEDLLLGNIAVKNGLVSPEDLQAALALQAKAAETTGLRQPLGEILYGMRKLSPVEIERLLAIQQAQRKLRGDPPQLLRVKGGPDDRLGKVLLDNGLVSEETLDQAVRVQAELASLGLRRKLGEVLVLQGVLSRENIEAALGVRESRIARKTSRDAVPVGGVRRSPRSGLVLATAGSILVGLIVLGGFLASRGSSTRPDTMAGREPRKPASGTARGDPGETASDETRTRPATVDPATSGSSQESAETVAPIAGPTGDSVPNPADLPALRPTEGPEQSPEEVPDSAWGGLVGFDNVSDEGDPDTPGQQAATPGPDTGALAAAVPGETPVATVIQQPVFSAEARRGLDAAVQALADIAQERKEKTYIEFRDRGGRIAAIRGALPEGLRIGPPDRPAADVVLPWGLAPLPAVQAFLKEARVAQRASREAAYLFHELGLLRDRDLAIQHWLRGSPGAIDEARSLVQATWPPDFPTGEEPVLRDGVWLPAAVAARLEGSDQFDGEAWTTRAELRERYNAARKASRRKHFDTAWIRRVVEQKTSWRSQGVRDVPPPLVWTGDLSRRIDLVFLSDGYTAKEMDLFRRQANTAMMGLIQTQPYANYRNYLNAHLVEVVAPRSGIPRGSQAAGWSAPIGSRVDEDDILTCDHSAARRFAGLAPDADLVVVLANTKGSGRSTGGGGVITLNAATGLDGTFVHELGHAFGRLDDEYVDKVAARLHPEWDSTQESWHINTTRQLNPLLAKWHYWNWPAAERGGVGAFEGAYYRPRGYYRPAPECLMQHGEDYCIVCLEQMERRFASCLDPIEEHLPRDSRVHAWQSDILSFRASTYALESGDGLRVLADAAWYLDGVPLPGGKVERGVLGIDIDPRQPLPARKHGIPPGRHVLALRLNLRSNRVRRDQAYLSTARVWTIELHAGDRPAVRVPSMDITLDWGDALEIDTPAVFPADGRPARGYRGAVENAPPGMSFDPATGRIRWVPAWWQSGRFRPRVIWSDGPHRVQGEFDIVVRSGRARGSRPVIVPIPMPWCEEGGTIAFELPVLDPDGDQVLVDLENPPEGSSWDPVSRRFEWRTRSTDGRGLVLRLRADDGGASETTATLKVLVLDRADGGTDPDDAETVFREVRSGDPYRQLRVLEGLRGGSRLVQMLAATQLLRAADPRVVAAAEEVVEAAYRNDWSPVAAAGNPLAGPSTARGSTIRGDENLLPEAQYRVALLGIFLRDVSPFIETFTDQESTLALVGRMVGLAESEHGDALDEDDRRFLAEARGRIQAVRAYNQRRGR